jgi:exonuclease SbcC
MIVKKLKLENIRSYKSQVIDIPLGRTLFEGDIGSGKSTILMAIEFALFGLGSEKPGSLLKAGETEGLVSIIFESGGREYLVQRRLVKKKNTFLQDDCVLRTGNEHWQYSAREIKEKVLEILDFNEPPDPKAQSVIYRYAIYTPQEEIKNVLALKPDLRLQTLRRAFRIEDYKVALENAKNLHGEIKIRAHDFATSAADLPEVKEKIAKIASWISDKSSELARLLEEDEEKKTLLGRLKQRGDSLQAEQLSLKAETGKIEDLLTSISRMRREIDLLKKKHGELEVKIGLNQSKIRELGAHENPSEKSVQELQAKIKEEETRERELREQETRIKTKLNDYDSILEEKICPTCDRPIETDSFSEKLGHKIAELKTSHELVEECSSNLSNLRKTLELKRDYERGQVTLNELTSKQAEYSADLEACDAKMHETTTTVDESDQKLEKARSSMLKLREIESQLSDVRQKTEACNLELATLGQEIGADRAHLRDWERESNDLGESLKKKQGQREKADKLAEHLLWIQDYFMPSVEGIEKQVMMNINQEFAFQFKRWFGMLVDDPGKEAKVDEDFTPIIQQDGIDQEVSYLSGGEKTSVALAYRLALNNIVRKVSTGMHSNVLILDEPTNGFSKEQLGKVREILDELDCPQIILVSHERELESFADQIFRVTKKDGISTISGGG